MKVKLATTKLTQISGCDSVARAKINPIIGGKEHRTEKINQLRDGWTILTKDGKPSAHFEHDVALVNGKPEILSTFKYIYEALGIESKEEDEFRKNL